MFQMQETHILIGVVRQCDYECLRMERSYLYLSNRHIIRHARPIPTHNLHAQQPQYKSFIIQKYEKEATSRTKSFSIQMRYFINLFAVSYFTVVQYHSVDRPGWCLYDIPILVFGRDKVASPEQFLICGFLMVSLPRSLVNKQDTGILVRGKINVYGKGPCGFANLLHWDKTIVVFIGSVPYPCIHILP